MPEKSLPKYRELPVDSGELYPNAWGVFGENDQLGTLNQLTPERLLAAKGSIKTGLTVNLNLSLDAFDPPLIAHRGVPKHEVFGTNVYHRDDRIDNLFLQASTQIDSLRHFAHPDKGFYNGFSGELLTAGTEALGIQNVAHKGIAGRGLLLDVAAYRKSIGQPINQETAEQISVDDLEATCNFQKSSVLPGDILMIRTGWLGAILSGNAARGSVLQSPGLAQDESIAEWLWDHQIAVAAADNVALEAWPADRNALPTNAEKSGNFELSSHTGMLHRILIPLLGITIGELWVLDELASRLRESGRFDCFITAEPLNIRGGVGSPANALAII